MAIIPQSRLFSWKDVENLGELKRLELVLKTMPDEDLMRQMEAERGRGRDDYPIRAVWNSLLAGIVYQHPSVESLRRELSRNDRLRWMCGFDPLLEAETAVPGPDNYSRFLHRLMDHQEEIDRIFDTLVEALSEELPGFGRHLACDSKGIRTHARARRCEDMEGLEPDGRRDLDADFGKKSYLQKRADGTLYKRFLSWFGYKLHLVVDADYELPVAYQVTRASRADNVTLKGMLEDMEDSHRELLKDCAALMGDKAYDDVKIIRALWDGLGIAPIIPKRQDWRDGDETRPLLEGADNIVYDCDGQLYCYCMWTGQRQAMVYWGYEAERGVQKWRCPAAVWGYGCKDWERCTGRARKEGAYGRVVRVPMDWEPRTFTPVARPSLKFRRLYKKRTAVERVNSRLDVSFGFERHFIRGQSKMRLRCSLALAVMLAMALGRARQKKAGRAAPKERAPTVRSLVGAV